MPGTSVFSITYNWLNTTYTHYDRKSDDKCNSKFLLLLVVDVTEASNAFYVCELRGAQAVLGSVTYLVHVIGKVFS